MKERKRAKKAQVSNVEDPFFSIVIPMFNAGHTIRTPLISIAAQIFQDFEIVFVDDCSTAYEVQERAIDSIVNACEIRNMKVYRHTPKNSGPGVARQLGVDFSSGKYIVFLDADDCFASPVSLLNMYQALLKENEPDILSTQFIEILSDHNTKVHDSGDIAWVHGKAYKRAFLQQFNVRFPTTRYTEDGSFNMLAFPLAPRVSCIPQLETYIWIKNPNSVVNSQDYIMAIMQHDYPAGYTYAYNELEDAKRNSAFVRSRGKRSEATEYLEISKKRMSVGGSIALYLYYQALRPRMTSPETHTAVELACKQMLLETRVIASLNEIQAREDWYAAIQFPLVQRLQTIIAQEPGLVLRETYIEWLERITGIRLQSPGAVR